MTVREILVYPDKRLLVTAPAVPVGEDGKFSPEVLAVCEDMKDTIKAYEAEGLAATQLGSTLRAFAVRTHPEPNSEFLICINPELVGDMLSLAATMTEGCLSFPSVNEPITRYGVIGVKYFKETGELVEETLEGIRAVAFQHELDHLNGTLFIEKMGSTQRYLALKKLSKLKQKVTRRFKSKIDANLTKQRM